MQATPSAAMGHRGLLAWQHALTLAILCHELADQLAPQRHRSLADQIRRAATSIPANIAEGHGRRTRGDFLRHLRISHGSLAELETHLLLAARRGYIGGAVVSRAMAELTHVGSLLGGLMRRLERSSRANDRGAPKR